LGHVLAKLAASDYAFVVKGVNIMPAAGAQSAMSESPMGMPQGIPGGFPQRFNNAPPPMQPAPENNGLQTVLDEQLLQVTMAIEVVKLSTK
jgi:hypothetical protein